MILWTKKNNCYRCHGWILCRLLLKEQLIMITLSGFFGVFVLPCCFFDFSEGVGAFVIGLSQISSFLAHLSQRLKWAIVIAHRPSSVRPSSVRPSVVRRPSVNFHIFNFFSRTAWWILMKLGRDEVLMVPYKCCCFSDRSAQGRIQGGAKIGHRGSPSSRIFFFRPEGYSNKPNG